MKKVILNKCYGTFDVSYIAYKRYCEKKHLPLFVYKMSIDTGSIAYEKVKGLDKFIDAFTYYFTKDYGDRLTELPKDNHLYLDSENREDPVLIEVVEELGEKASSSFSDLVVVEIPDDLDYVIDNYDGIETLHQKVQEW